MAVCLALPLYSCNSGGKAVTVYPSSYQIDGQIYLGLICLIPLIVLIRPRSKWLTIAGIAACAAGLDYMTYVPFLWATQLLAGWYVYTASSLAYIVGSIVELKRRLIPQAPVRPTCSDN